MCVFFNSPDEIKQSILKLNRGGVHNDGSEMWREHGADVYYRVAEASEHRPLAHYRIDGEVEESDVRTVLLNLRGALADCRGGGGQRQSHLHVKFDKKDTHLRRDEPAF